MIRLEPNQKRRLIKVQFESGKWINLKKTYSNQGKLNAHLNTLRKEHGEIKGVYSGISQWLNPTALEYRRFDKPILLTSDFVIDIDDEDSYDSNHESLAIKKYLSKNKNLRFLKRLRSGGGFYLKYKVLNQPSISNPAEREQWFKKQKIKICEQLIQAGFTGIDYGKKKGTTSNVCADIYRVIRMEGSPHPSGNICHEVNDSYSWATNHPLIKGGADETTPTSETTAAEANPSKQSRHPFLEISITNQILGIKGYYIIYAEIPPTNKSISRLKDIQHQYALTDFHLFNLNTNKIGALCLDIVTGKKLNKILRALHSRNQLTFQKYKQVWIPVTNYNKHTKKISKLYPFSILPNKTFHQRYQSTTHAQAFNISIKGKPVTSNIKIINQVCQPK